MKIKEFISLIIKGIFVGTGAILPGVSGGVLCVAFGIYEPMMALLSHPIKSFKKYYKMFIPFILGWLLGFILLARLVEALFTKSSSLAMMLFAGLIFGTLPQLLQEADEDKAIGWSPLIISIVLFVLIISGMNSGNTLVIEINPLWYIFAGAIWGLSLVLPGLSSSSLLILMGLYQPMTSGIASLDMSVILPLITGLAITVLSTARIINQMFTQKRGLILKIVVGIVIASTIFILPTTYPSISILIMSLFSFLIGYIVSRNMDIQKAKLNI